MSATSAPRDEVRALTGIRAAAALWVLVFHLSLSGCCDAIPALRWAKPLASAGWMGVDLFFVLSGFILTRTYAPQLASLTGRGYASYLGARFARVYPVHAFVLGAMAAWVVVAKLGWAWGPWAGDRYRLREFLVHAGLLQSWGLLDRGTWNAPSWSVSAEAFAYLWFPLTCGALLRVRSAAVAIGAAGAALAAAIVVVPAVGQPGAGLNQSGPAGLARIAGEFLAGCLLCRAADALRGRRVPWAAISLAAGAAAVALPWAGLGDPWAVFAFAALIVSLAQDDGPLARVLASGPFVLGGRASYALYMVHFPVLSVASWFLGGELEASWGAGRTAAWLAAHVLGPVAVALLVWRFVEEPARRRLRAWFSPRTARPRAADPVPAGPAVAAGAAPDQGSSV